MADVGYSVEWQVLNSKHLGVPQNRERVFIIGHLGKDSSEKVFPIATDYPKVDELRGQRVCTNTLDTRIEGDTRGSYPLIDSGGGTTQMLKVNGYHKA